jgi:hypothetical protein
MNATEQSLIQMHFGLMVEYQHVQLVVLVQIQLVQQVLV